MAMAIISSRTRLGRRLFLASPFVLAAGSALAQSAEIKFKRSSLVIATGAREIKFDVELALNDAERARGLMFRDKLGPYDGMLFDFYQDAPVSFWMKNTLIPLDMVFIAGDGTVKHVHANATPLSTDPIPSEFPGARGARDQRRQRQASGHQARRQGQAPDLRQRELGHAPVD